MDSKALQQEAKNVAEKVNALKSVINAKVIAGTDATEVEKDAVLDAVKNWESLKME